MNAQLEQTASATHAEIMVQAVRPWMIIYRTRYQAKLKKGLHIPGMGETVAELERLANENPDMPVGLITYNLSGNHHYVFYDLAHAREIGHYHLPKAASIEE